MLPSKLKAKRAISRAATIGVIVVIIIIIVGGSYALLARGPAPTTSTSPTSITTTSGGTTTITTTSTSQTGVPSSLTYETPNTIAFLDPQVSYFTYDYVILQSVYEPLIWYNGSSGTQVVPWLAQNYSLSSDGKALNVTLRSGITFADGEQLNSTAVYFSLNKLLIEDASSPAAHGGEASWIVQQLLNTSLSWALGGPHKYNQTWGNDVLAQNFVQITGPLSFTLHIQHPNAALPYLLAGEWAGIVAPDYVMQKDLSMWMQTGNNYTLPYTTPSGNATTMINQYLLDEVATCDTGVTPSGCGTTYLDGSYQGSLAGTGPYTIQSVDKSSGDIVLQANPHYWGGPYQYLGGAKISAQIPTIYLNNVPSQTTREIDLQNAAKSGQAMIVDVTGDHLYDVADRGQWLNNNQLVSTIPGVSIFGVYPQIATLFDPFATNVTNSASGTFYKFQPFADLRMRLAFADAVNMTEINNDVNNKLGQVAINDIPPGLPPGGVYNESLTPRYSYNLTGVQNLLLSAMEHPLTSFNLANGTAAPSGMFNNAFGCATLNSNNQCSNPITQNIPVVYATGDTVDQAIFVQIAGVINNISSTYNMGLTVSVTPIPSGTELVQAEAGYLYMYSFGWFADYPWAIDFLTAVYQPSNIYPSIDHMNYPLLGTYYSDAVAASGANNISGLIHYSNLMNIFANQQVMYLWTFYPGTFMVATSNLHGFTYNPSLDSTGAGIAGPQYFADFS